MPHRSQGLALEADLIGRGCGLRGEHYQVSAGSNQPGAQSAAVTELPPPSSVRGLVYKEVNPPSAPRVALGRLSAQRKSTVSGSNSRSAPL